MTLTQHQKAWARIKPQAVETNREHFNRLLDYWDAKVNAPRPSNQGKSIAKGRAKGYGQVLKKSFIRASVPIEKHFI